jgi:hypothetical protein
VVEVIGETIAAMKLAFAESWKQVWTDGTSRRQIPFAALIIGLLGANESDAIDPVVVSSCIFTEDERAETQAAGLIDKIDSLKHRLARLIQEVEKKCPEFLDSVPTPDGIDINKLADGGVIMTDTCNTAQKIRRILLDHIDGAMDLDCMNHLRNVWIGGMEKALAKYLNALLRSSLDEIDPTIRVTTSITAIIRAIDKEFSLSANYPKGHGELFLEWIRENHPGVLLFHVERASGSRQDLCTEGSMAVFMNYPYYVEFLDEQLRKVKQSNQQASILQQNLFVALTSVEMIALARLLSILHISIFMPFRFIAGKCHEFKKYHFGAADMGRVMTTLHRKLKLVKEKIELILDPLFMNDIFQEFRNELPPFAEYWELMFKKKQMKVVARKDGSKVVYYSRLRKCLFDPRRKTDKETNAKVIELASTAVTALISELEDGKKATYKYLDVSGSEYCYAKCSDERKSALLGVTATNDEAESALGMVTGNIQRYGRINLASAAAVANAKRSKLFQRRDANSNRSLGFFHQFEKKVQEAIVSVAMQDAPKTRIRNNEALELQAKARKEKEDVLREKGLEKASEEYIDAVYYHRMYNSYACWKNDPKVVTKELAKLSSDRAKYRAIKENIMIRVKGFGWDWCKHPWSKDNRKYSVFELARHLQFIIKKEKSMDIPTEPPFNVPQRLELGVLGTQTSIVADLDKKFAANENEYKSNAERIRCVRESHGQGDMYSQLQPFSQPELNELVERRIDVLYSVEMDDGSVTLRWCQGEVLRVVEGVKDPTVEVEWDPMPDVSGYEHSQISIQRLLPSLWNKDKEGGWRMDVEIDLFEDEIDNDSDSEIENEFVEDICYL